MRKYLLTALLMASICLPPLPALATENAFGRYIPGVFAGPASQIVPPVPGFYMQSSTFFYKGSAKKDIQLPIGRDLKSKVDVEYFSTALTGVYVPEWTPGKNMSVGLGLTVPLQTLYIKAGAGSLWTSDRATSLGDIMLTPAVGWHDGPHLATANVTIYMPTGDYDKDNLANIGLNCWTFTPSLAYTYVNPEKHIDFSITAGVDISTWNNDTHYRSGEMLHADATLLWTYEGFGAGVFGSVLYQFTDDEGALADQLGGFRGRSFSVGPMLKYSAGGEHEFTVNLNWAPEFHVKNRVEGDGFFLNMTLKF
ncbi:conserved exported hypothetical protein [uncultured delta proteobacterium]|uniref:Protein involved in meta-pathway of phenol degradation n=1 Tax=uncultured delta proteobacterium TaxID=34034 RepID=A0A212KFH0_9DELT|nr:conserved exported hypothetical protein [uncultured delta proteobacterium]